jgi:hypothetical protein
MPINPLTNKTDRHAWDPEVLLRFRIGQQRERLAAGAGKGKQHADSPPDAGEPDASGSAPSLLAPLASMQALALDSGSSAGNTPAESPVPLILPSIPPLPVLSAPSKTRRASKRLAGEFVSKPTVTASA